MLCNNIVITLYVYVVLLNFLFIKKSWKKNYLKDHVALKTGVMAKNILCIPKIYYINYITIYN